MFDRFPYLYGNILSITKKGQGFTLKYREHNSRGSFVAWGIGFHYRYDPDTKILDIIDARRQKPLLFLDFDGKTSKDPLTFTRNLDKANQINALIFSNNTTNDLSETLEDRRLVPILENSVFLAHYCFDLNHGKFQRFAKHFCGDFALKNIQIDRVENINPEASYFLAELRTLNNNAITSRATSLHSVIRKLSEKAVQDLMTAEYGNVLSGSAHNLLTASSKLSIISRILDENFSPHRRIQKMREIQEMAAQNEDS